MNLTLANLFKIKEIRNKILITLGLLLVYRVGSFIPLPGVNFGEALKSLQDVGGINKLFGMMNVLTGGSLLSATLFSLGVMPYISASIIFSLLTKAVPALEKIAKEGQSGQRRINQYTRLTTVAICLLQSWFVIFGALRVENSRLLHTGVSDWFGIYCIIVMVGLTAGTLFIMWLGEQISEHGVGNGISLIIMAGIISNLYPSMASYLEGFDRGAWQTLLTFLGAWAIAVVAVVYMTKAQRRIPIQNAKHQRGRNVYGGERAFLPFKLNQANVMPIIFASALLIIPQFLGTATGITWLEQAFSSQTSGFWYVLTYTALIFFFAFFWTSMMFQPNEIAKNLQEQGSFVPGIRPGRQTAEFLESTMFRITLAGASFLAVVAIIPSFVGASGGGAMDMALLYFMSGTSILIVVGVALDMVEKLNAMLVMRNYETTMKEGEASAASGSGWGRRSS